MSNLFWKSRPFLALFGLALFAASAAAQPPAPASPPDSAPAPGPGADAESYVKYGIAKAAGGDLDAADSAFTEAIKLDPKYAPAYRDRGRALAQQHKGDEAILDFDQALQIDPNDEEALYRRGSVKGQTGDFDGAIADFNRLVTLAPQSAMAYYARGHAKYFKGDLDGAMTDLNQAITLQPGSSYSYFIRGLIRRARNDREGAIADFQKSADDGYAYSAFWLWITQTEEGKRDIARQALTQALAKPGLFKPNDWASTLGNFLLQKETQADLIARAGQGQGDEAEDRLCEAWFYSGMATLLAGDKKGAQEPFLKAVATGAKSSEEFVEANRELAALPKP